jgi:hypothetical protein
MWERECRVDKLLVSKWYEGWLKARTKPEAQTDGRMELEDEEKKHLGAQRVQVRACRG